MTHPVGPCSPNSLPVFLNDGSAWVCSATNTWTEIHQNFDIMIVDRPITIDAFTGFLVIASAALLIGYIIGFLNAKSK